jgi:hypothetical protein
MSNQQMIGEFLSKWGPGGLAYNLNERQGAQQHFVELCAVLEVSAPVGGEDYVFEKGTLALGQQRGFADVFKRGHFAWEYKAPGKPLDAALRQLMMYALALDNPPLLIVSDRLRIEIHTHFNGTPSVRSANSSADVLRHQKVLSLPLPTGRSLKMQRTRSRLPPSVCARLASQPKSPLTC